MGCSSFANLCFQMGVTVMGFAENNCAIGLQAKEEDPNLFFLYDFLWTNPINGVVKVGRKS